mgnify:CR=1 FL=1
MNTDDLLKNAREFTRIDQIKALRSKYREIKVSGSCAVVIDNQYRWGVVTLDDETVVPFGKYGWIDSFDSGLARVRNHGKPGYSSNVLMIIDEKSNFYSSKSEIDAYLEQDRKEHPERYAKWGIINEDGEEVLPLEYDEIWSFSGKGRCSTRATKNGVSTDIYFHDLNPLLPKRPKHSYNKRRSHHYHDSDYFTIDDCFDCEGNFDPDRLEDAFYSGEYVPEDW